MYQDDVIKKPNSLIARRDLIIQTMINALVDKQNSTFIFNEERVNDTFSFVNNLLE